MQFGEILEGLELVFLIIIAGIALVIAICVIGCDYATTPSGKKDKPEGEKEVETTPKDYAIICVILIFIMVAINVIF
ncbi:MAG: hypothetical protein GF411_01215 [Candidatus Lokiarchaeota archaeon]|nr:hypothetical protein [Candidatus Lokiarchaeota archaeon]